MKGKVLQEFELSCGHGHVYVIEVEDYDLEDMIEEGDYVEIVRVAEKKQEGEDEIK